MDPASFAGPPIDVRLGGVSVAGRIDFILNNTAVVFTPNLPLPVNSTVSVTLLPATDLFGNAEGAGTSYTFYTLDFEPPVVNTVSITPLQTSVLAGTNISVAADLAAASDVAYVEFLVNGESRLGLSRNRPTH